MLSARFFPGERAPETAVFRVVHLHHRRPHDVLVPVGVRFPSCRLCADAVRYEYVTAAPCFNSVISSLMEDIDFVHALRKKSESGVNGVCLRSR